MVYPQIKTPDFCVFLHFLVPKNPTQGSKLKAVLAALQEQTGHPTTPSTKRELSWVLVLTHSACILPLQQGQVVELS